jgi:hypothetical protein
MEITVVGMFSVIAVDEAGGCKTSFFGGKEDSIDGADEARIVRADEEDEGSD